MKHISVTILFSLSMLSGFSQMIPNQSVEILYDSRGNRVVRQIWTNNQNPGNKRQMESETIPEINVSIYPNPSREVITIQYTMQKAGDFIEVLDVTGRIVGSFILKDESSFSMDVSALSTGAYLVRIKSLDQIISSKFIKQ